MRTDVKHSGLCFLLGLVLLTPGTGASPALAQRNRQVVQLPAVARGGPGSLTDLVHRRRSVRSFGPGKLKLEQLALVLFSAQGITRQGRYRAVPSAGALYPLELHVVVGVVEGLTPGVYRYDPKKHALGRVVQGDRRAQLTRAALGQRWIASAQAVLVISCDYHRVTGKYGERGVRYAHIEAGAAAQNASLSGVSVGLSSTVVGAFDDGAVGALIAAAGEARPLVLLPLGLPKNDLSGN